MIAISIKAHNTPKGIQENGAFSINLPTRSMVEVTEYCGYCGLVSGRTTGSFLFRNDGTQSFWLHMKRNY